MATANQAKEVLPANTYGRIFFAFAPPCTDSCADNEFGNSSLNSPHRNFLVTGQAAAKSPLVQSLTTLVGALTDWEFGKMTSMLIVFVPPCARLVATACALGEALKWHVRVEYVLRVLSASFLLISLTAAMKQPPSRLLVLQGHQKRLGTD